MPRVVKINGVTRHLGGCVPDRADHRDFKLTAPPGDLPPAASLRHHFPPKRDQGSYGSCALNALCASAGYLYTKNNLPDPIFSRLLAYYLCRQEEGTPATEDSGVQIRDAMSVAAKFGFAPETVWPYDEGHFSLEPTIDVLLKAAEHKALYYYRVPDLSTLKSSIVNGFPVLVGFAVPANMQEQAIETGIVEYPKENEAIIGGHCMLAGSYDDDKRLVGCANWWGDVGDDSWFYLPYNFFTGGGSVPLVSDCWTLRLEML